MSRRRPLNPNAREALDQMKYEISSGLGINSSTLDGNSLSSRQNGVVGGSVGAEMTRRLVQMGEEMLINQYNK